MNKIIFSSKIFFRRTKIFFIFLLHYRTNNIVILTEHLGDIIAISGLPEYLYNKNKKKTIWVINKKYKIILDNNPFISKTITIQNLGEFVILDKILPKYIFAHHLNSHYSGLD